MGRRVIVKNAKTPNTKNGIECQSLLTSIKSTSKRIGRGNGNQEKTK